MLRQRVKMGQEKWDPNGRRCVEKMVDWNGLAEAVWILGMVSICFASRIFNKSMPGILNEVLSIIRPDNEILESYYKLE